MIDLTGDGDSSTDSLSYAIDPGLPGTGWTLTVFSSAVSSFTISGSAGEILIGNNTSVHVTDRYIATLFGSGPIPGGGADYFFQIDLFDSSGAGADIINSGDLDTVPNLALAESDGSRLVVPANNLGCLDCNITMTSLTISAVPTPPECDIQMSQTAYFDDDTVTVDVFRISNLGSAPIVAEWKIWLGAPGLPPISIFNMGADGSLALSAGFDVNLEPFPLLPVTADLPRGTYEFSCRMLNPVTGELLAEDRNIFDIQ
ncbi:MAG: hypothetical protein GY785_13355 [Gammaproteobacteria bacterium]|nr:hypothetical protein [Gammaproteobacteria bacterium]